MRSLLLLKQITANIINSVFNIMNPKYIFLCLRYVNLPEKKNLIDCVASLKREISLYVYIVKIGNVMLLYPEGVVGWRIM